MNIYTNLELSKSWRQYEWTDFFQFNPASRHRRRIILSLLKSLDFDNVVDVGCGDGTLLKMIYNYFHVDIHGMDVYDSLVTSGLENILTSYTKLNIEEAYISEKKFDVVICSEVIEHVKDWQKAISNLCSMSSKYLLITVPAGKIHKTDQWMGHYRHYNIKELIEIMNKNGFYPVKYFYWGFPFHFFYRMLLDIFPRYIMKHYGVSRYGFFKQFICELFYLLFFANIRGIGKQIFLLTKKNKTL